MSLKQIVFSIALIGAGVLFFVAKAYEQTPVEGIIRYIGKPLQIVGAIADANGKMPVDDLAALADSDFEAVGEVPTFGFSASHHWIRIRIFNFENSASYRILEVNNPILNQCNLYEIKNERAVKRFSAGDDHVFAERPVDHLNFQFPIHMEPNSSIELLLQVSSLGEQLQVPLGLWDAAELTVRDEKDRLLRGIYFGIILFVLLFNSFIYLIIREKSSVYYVLYVFALLMLQLSLGGFAFRYLWPESSYMANIANPFFASLSIFALIRFTQLFLNLKEFYPRLNKAYYVIATLVAANAILSLIYTPGVFRASVLTINILALLLNILIVPTVVMVMRKDFKPARFFLYAFVALVTSVFFFILNNFGVFRSEFYAAYGLQIGSALEVILLSFAIVDKFKRFREDAFARLVTINQMKARANEDLEKKVVERTEEITAAKLVVEQQKEEIVDSIRYAERIQKSLLPSEGEITRLFEENFVLFKPRDIVSGDFYWFGETRPNRQWKEGAPMRLFAAVDCTGHGVPGALMSILGHNGLEQCIHATEVNSPGTALRHINNEIIRTLQHEKHIGDTAVRDGMDMVLCAYDPAARQLHFAGSKNNIYIYRGSDFIEIKGDRTSIGADWMETAACFTDHVIDILPGDRVYAFTDGYPDQFGGERNKKLKSRPLLDIIAQFAEMGMEEQKLLLSRTFELWRGENEQIDDVCLLGIKF